MRNIFKLRFSLATLLVVVTALSIWFANITNDAREQAAAIKGIQAKEGIVQFDTIAVPDWLKKAIGEEYFRDEQSVDFATNRGRTRATNEPKATAATLEYLASLANIESLELGNNREVTDSSLVLLTPLKNLTTLYLYRTGIRGPGLVHVAKLPKLSAISLSDTELDDSGAKHLGRMSRLAWARLDNTRLTDSGMSELAQATALKTLTLRNTGITDRGLVYLEQLKQLEVLNLVGTRVTAAGVARLKQTLPKCRVEVTFGLGETPDDKLLFPTGYNPTFAEVNAKLKELKIDGEVQTDSTRPGHPIVTLRLFDSRLSSNAVLCLVRQVPSLEVLNLRRGLVDDEFVEGLGESKIRYLSLQATRITDQGLRHLPGLPSLAELVLTETDISDEGLTHLRELSNLRSIVLDYTRVTADGVTRLRQSLPDCSVAW